MRDESSRSKYYILVVIFIVAASCLRVFDCFQHNPMDYRFSDMIRHWNSGLRFPHGGYYGGSDPIGYQVYVWILIKITRTNRYLIALAAALLSVLMPWTYYRAARNFGLSKLPALWVWALIAWTPSLLTIYHYFMMETPLLFLEGVALWMTARYLRRGGTWPFLYSIFFWTMASLTKPTVIPMAVMCVLWSWWKKRTPIRDLAIGAALAIALLVPQAIRSNIELGFIAPFGNPWLTKIILRSGAKFSDFDFVARSARTQGGIVHLGFLSPSCTIQPLAPLSSWAIRRAYGNSEARVAIDSANGVSDWKKAYASYNEDSYEWMAQWRENVVLFFFAPSWPESQVGQWDGWLETQSRWIWAPLILLVMVCNLREFLMRRFDLIPVAITLFTILLLTQNVVLTEGRYRKPLEPLLLLNLVWVLRPRQAEALTPAKLA